MRNPSSARPSAAFVTALLFPVISANAATIESVSVERNRWENGELVAKSSFPGDGASKATGAAFSSMTFSFFIEPPPDQPQPIEGTQAIVSSAQYTIEPETGETEGQCVLVDWAHQAGSSLSVSGNAEALVGAGSGNPAVATNPPSISIPGPTRLELLPLGGSASTLYTFGPNVLAPSDADFNVDASGVFVARIRDDVSAVQSGATAWYVAPGDSAEGQLSSQLQASVRAGVVNCADFPIEISVGDATRVEGDSGSTAFTFPVSVSSTVEEVSVTFQTADGTASTGDDYTALGPMVITFPQGGATTQDVKVQVSGDTVPEADETFTVELSDPSDLASLADASGLGSIEDDDAFKSDVTATKNVSGDVFPGGTVIYDIQLDNAGPGVQLDNPGDEFVDMLPPSLDLVDASADAGSVVADLAGNTARWNGRIPAGGSVGIMIEARIHPDVSIHDSIANQGTVNFDPDGDGSNDASRATDNPVTASPGDSTVFAVARIPGFTIPMLGGLALGILALMFAALGMASVRR